MTDIFSKSYILLLLFFSESLMSILCILLKSSVTIQQQMIQNKGFLVIGYFLEKVGQSTLYIFLQYKLPKSLLPGFEMQTSGDWIEDVCCYFKNTAHLN